VGEPLQSEREGHANLEKIQRSWYPKILCVSIFSSLWPKGGNAIKREWSTVLRGAHSAAHERMAEMGCRRRVAKTMIVVCTRFLKGKQLLFVDVFRARLTISDCVGNRKPAREYSADTILLKLRIWADATAD